MGESLSENAILAVDDGPRFGQRGLAKRSLVGGGLSGRGRAVISKGLLPLLLATAMLVSIAPRGATAASITGGALNAPGERSQNFGLGYPELFWAYEFRVQSKMAFAVRVGLQVWPLSLTVGPWIRLSIHERDKVAVSVLVHPSLNLAGFGGTRGFYPRNANFGRSRVFRPSIGPGINIGLLGTFVLSRQWDMLIAFENPVAVWIWTGPPDV